MQKKWISILLLVCIISTILVGCNGNSDANLVTSSNVNLNKEKQISSKDFSETMEAYKEFYDTFYEEHRFNGSYEDSWDCFANIYMLEGKPIMAIMDILSFQEHSYYDERGTQCINEVAIFDLYIYEYNGREVQERAKYVSLQSSDEEVYLYPMQNKLFLNYYNENDKLVTAELGEYCTPLELEYYYICCDDTDYEVIDAEYIENAKEDWFHDETYERVSISFDVDDEYLNCEETGFIKTDLGEYGHDGSRIFRVGRKSIMHFAAANYSLLNDYIIDDAEGCFYSTNFKKYLDYLIEQDITNNVDLRVCHNNYIYDNYEFEDYDLKTIVWMDGIYYVVEDDVAYVYAFDYGYTEEDLPKDLCGYEISDQYWVDVQSDNSDITVSIKHRLNLYEVWEQVLIAKEEYSKSFAGAFDAYEEYMYEKEYVSPDYYYAFIFIDDDDIPELYVENVWGFKTLLIYSEGQVSEVNINCNYFSYYERQDVFVTDSRYEAGGYDIYVYNIKDGEVVTLVEGSACWLPGDSYAYYIGSKVVPTEQELNNQIDSMCPAGTSIEVGIFENNVYFPLQEAADKEGLTY